MGRPAAGTSEDSEDENSAGMDPINQNVGGPGYDEFACSSHSAWTSGARCNCESRNRFANSLRNEFRIPQAVFGDVGNQFMQVAPRSATPGDFHSGALFQPLLLPGGAENLCDLLHDLLMGNAW